jgi:hypothetical protein
MLLLSFCLVLALCVTSGPRKYVIIRIDQNWIPVVSQLHATVEEDIREQVVLDRFKSMLKTDPLIQQLQLW